MWIFACQAEKLGFHSQIILSGRIVNDLMASYVADKAIQKKIEAGQAPKKSKVVILGLTFKENCPDCRNSKVADIIDRFQEYGILPDIVDPWADREAAEQEYGLELKALDEIQEVDCVIVAVAHKQFKEMGLERIQRLYRKDTKKVLIDVKGIYRTECLQKSDLLWWRL